MYNGRRSRLKGTKSGIENSVEYSFLKYFVVVLKYFEIQH